MELPSIQNYSEFLLNFNVGWFSLILDCIEIESELPYEISKGIRVNRASPEQLSKIKNKLRTFLGMHEGWESYFESAAIEQSSEKPNSWEPDQLPEEKWRYYIIEIEGGNMGKLIDLEYASSVSLMPIKISALTFSLCNTQHSYQPGILNKAMSQLVVENGFQNNTIHF